MTSVIKMTSKGTGRKSNVQRPTVSKAMGYWGVIDEIVISSESDNDKRMWW